MKAPRYTPLAAAALLACAPLEGGFDTPLGQTTPGQLVGRLAYPDGSGAVGVEVVLRQGEVRQRARAGDAGRFVFEAPPLGAVELAGHDRAGLGFHRRAVVEAGGLNDAGEVALSAVGDLAALATFPGLGLEERVTSLSGRCEHPRATEDGRAVICLRTVGDDRSRVVSSIDVRTGVETVLATIPAAMEQGPCSAGVERVQGRIAAVRAPNGALLVDLARPGPDAIVASAHDADHDVTQLCAAIPFAVAGAELRHLAWKEGEPWAQIRDSLGIPYPRVMYRVEVVRQDLDAAPADRVVERSAPFPAEMGAWMTARSAPGGFAMAMTVAAWCPRKDCSPLLHRELELAPYDAQMLVVRAGDAAPYRLAREPGSEIYRDAWALTQDASEVWTIEGGMLRATDVSSGRHTQTSTALPVADALTAYTLHPTSDGDQFFASGVTAVDGGSMISVLRFRRSTGEAHPYPLIGADAGAAALPSGMRRVSHVRLDEADRLIVVQELGAPGDSGRPQPSVTRVSLDGDVQHETYPGPIDDTRGPATLASLPGGAREALVDLDPTTGRLQVFEGPRGGALHALPQRTFLDGSHQAPFYAPDGRTLYFWADDPASNYPQLFRLEVGEAP